MLRLESPYDDATTHVVLSPLEFMQRLTALVPRPRLHRIRFHGLVEPRAKLRAAIVPQPAQNDIHGCADHAYTSGRSNPARLS